MSACIFSNFFTSGSFMMASSCPKAPLPLASSAAALEAKSVATDSVREQHLELLRSGPRLCVSLTPNGSVVNAVGMFWSLRQGECCTVPKTSGHALPSNSTATCV